VAGGSSVAGAAPGGNVVGGLPGGVPIPNPADTSAEPPPNTKTNDALEKGKKILKGIFKK
jgi:hypothetical protein